MKILESVLRQMLEFNMGRGDLVIAVGGGVVGDLAGLDVYKRQPLRCSPICLAT